MEEGQAKDKPSSHLSAAQVIAGAMASVSAAVVASIFGVAGTIIGAALTSVTLTIGTALYKLSLERAQSRIRYRHDQARGPLPASPEPTPPPRRSFAWGAVAAATLLVFVLAMGTLTGLEALAKTPAAAVMGKPPDQEVRAPTTVGTVLRDATSEGDDEAIPAPLPTEPAPSGSVPSQSEPIPSEPDDGQSPLEPEGPELETPMSTETEPMPTETEIPEPSATEPAALPSLQPSSESPEHELDGSP